MFSQPSFTKLHSAWLEAHFFKNSYLKITYLFYVYKPQVVEYLNTVLRQQFSTHNIPRIKTHFIPNNDLPALVCDKFGSFLNVFEIKN